MPGRLISSVFLCLIMFTASGWAQVFNVNSKIKIIGGEAFYVHSVLGGQTLQTIANAYFTEVSLIEKHNFGQSDPLVSAVKLKIPYSDESLEAMSKKAKNVAPKTVPTYVKVDTASKAPSKESKQPDKSTQKTSPTEQQSPMEEAIGLFKDPEPVSIDPVEKNTKVEKEKIEPKAVVSLPEPEPISNVVEETSLDDPEKALSDLENLSKNINESLESLAKIQEALEPSKVNPKTGELIVPVSEVLPKNSILASTLLERQVVNYFDTSSSNSFKLKEFFITEVNSDARITSLKDERTLTNQNTNYLILSDLKGLSVDSLDRLEQKMAMGFVVDIVRYKYKVKIKKNKVRLYQTQGYVEHFPKENQHAQLIMEAAKNAGIKGKGEVVIMDGYKEVSSFQAFEYNPFGTKDKTIMHLKALRIEQMIF